MEGGIPALGFNEDGYYLGLKFSNFASGLTYNDVKVGIVPSATGMDLQTLDNDKNAVGAGLFQLLGVDVQFEAAFLRRL